MKKRAWLGLENRRHAISLPVFVVGETPTRYRITPAGKTRIPLAGLYRWLRPGAVALVPKGAVSFPKEKASS